MSFHYTLPIRVELRIDREKRGITVQEFQELGKL